MRTDYSDVSFWLATYGLYQPNDPLQGDIKADVAIICLDCDYTRPGFLRMAKT